MRLPITILATSILSTSLLVACQPQSSAPADPTVTQAPADAPKPLPTMPPTTPEGTSPAIAKDSPAVATGKGEVSLSQWDGYGESKFGIDEAQFRSNWGGDLKKGGDDKACFHLSPLGQKSQSELAFMFTDGKFSRYSSENARLIAPGGGKVGMTRAEIDKRYAGQIEEQPHKYVEGGKYLRIKHGADVLIFETDEGGKVSEWRVGVPPQVDYVEGCS